MAKRITVEWMIDVPRDEHGDHDFDTAKWRCQIFEGDQLKAAREFAQAKANANAFGQSWLYIEYADSAYAPDWRWERDYSADQIFERDAT